MFKETDIEKINMNPFSKISGEWALLTAGTRDNGFNMMTVSWAGFGRFWEKNALTVYVRESRYTRKFMDKTIILRFLFTAKNTAKRLIYAAGCMATSAIRSKNQGLSLCFSGTQQRLRSPN
jgi:hypothetical protein